MSSTATALLEAALKLPSAERGDLARRLLDSLDPDDRDIDAMSDEEFVAELDRRMAESDRDPSVRVPWDQVQDMR